MKFECSKRVRATLRQLAGVAHERELRTLLEGLETSFGRWRRGESDTETLDDELDRFVRGPERHHLAQLYGGAKFVHMSVAQAVVRGILAPDEVPQEVLDALENALEFFRAEPEDGIAVEED